MCQVSNKANEHAQHKTNNKQTDPRKKRGKTDKQTYRKGPRLGLCLSSTVLRCLLGLFGVFVV
jgi:hypothetical protein